MALLLKCRKCPGEFDPIFFRQYNPDGYINLVCIGCEQTRTDQIKLKNRPKHKAAGAIRRHAKKYNMKPTEFANKYGWHLENMVHDLKHTHDNGCMDCREPFASMGHGLQDVSIDITDTLKDPFYGVNTRWICQSCNRLKGSLSPEKWAKKLIAWRQWKHIQEQLKSDIGFGLPMNDYWAGRATVGLCVILLLCFTLPLA